MRPLCLTWASGDLQVLICRWTSKVLQSSRSPSQACAVASSLLILGLRARAPEPRVWMMPSSSSSNSSSASAPSGAGAGAGGVEGAAPCGVAVPPIGVSGAAPAAPDALETPPGFSSLGGAAMVGSPSTSGPVSRGRPAGSPDAGIAGSLTGPESRARPCDCRASGSLHSPIS